MPTTVVKTIGTGGDYTTLQAWEDASPANLVTADQIWQGQCFNQEFFSSSAALLSVSGSTTDATRYKELTTYAGASFIDNANAQTNALRYNASNGAAIRGTYAWAGPVSVNESYFRISKVQIQSSTAVAFNGGGTTGMVMDKCIVENSGTSNEALKTYGSCTVKNSLIVGRSSGVIALLSNGTNAYNCTFARTGSGTANIFNGSYGASTLKNCAFFGAAATLAGGSTSKTYTTCYTDTSSPPSGCTTVAYDTSTGSGFENKTDSTRDFRIKTGSALLDVGTTDTTNAANDIVGTARPQGSAYDVGAWELVVASGNYTASITEAATLAATHSVQAALSASATESATLSHSQDAVIGRLSAISEAIALIDSLNGAASMGGSATEAMTLADTPNRAFGATGVATEAVTLAATHSAAYAATVAATEAMTLADTASGALAGGSFTATVTEAAALANTQAQAYGASGSTTEPLTLDGTASNVASLSAATSEAITLSAAQDVGAAAYSASISESLPLASSGAAQYAAFSVATESMALAGSQSVSGQFGATATESLALAASQAQQAALTAALVEALSLSSGAAASWGTYAALVASLTLDTTASQTLNALFTASDFWAYQITPQSLRYSVPTQNLRYTVTPQDLKYSIAQNNLAYSIQ